MADNIGSTEGNSVAITRAIESARYVGYMINIISIIAGVISLVVVISVVVIAISGGVVPDVLSNWGGIILGFYFSQFLNIVNGYMGILEKAK
ncbi:hypothetical protein ELH39_01015 [Rhizobium ruizarguesonis]|uniref:hypothetical protein n=1 Tax=Rhizobium ruizarguesonis TaxID=2081791 RepID=UPI0010307AC0|nr:hypothetical protein [Rhizobium ruizarguesonis]TBB95930.1 hypothetical protein ELH39_01015 [Rhizobium ruizarguesonis]